MVEVVADSIIAQLEVQLGNYVTNFGLAADAHERFTRTRPDKVGQFSVAEVQQYSDRHKQASEGIAVAEEKSTERVKRTRKARADSAVETDRAVAASAKASADAQIKEAERVAAREAQLDANARSRIIHDPRVQPAASSTLGRTVAREGAAIPNSPIPTTIPEVAAEREVNHLLADQLDLQARKRVVQGDEKRILDDGLTRLRLIQGYRRAGLTEIEATERAERQLLVIEERRAAIAAEQAAFNGRAAAGSARRFAEGATLGYGPAGATLAGIAVAGGVAAGAAAVASSANFAKDLTNTSEALGLSTKALQVYQAAAVQAGGTTEQFRTALSHLADQIGKAKEGDQTAAALFGPKGLNIDLSQFKTAGDALPTIIDRLSQVSGTAQGATLRTAAFGEEASKLDSLLSGGNAKVNELADAMQRTGAVLSDGDIARLADVAKKFEQVKVQLQVDLAQIVAGNKDAILGLADALAKLAANLGPVLERFREFRVANEASLKGDISKFAFATGNIQGGIDYARQSADASKRLEDMRSEYAQNQLNDKFPIPGGFGQVQPGKPGSGFHDPKGPKGPSADTLARRAEERQKYFDDTLAGLNNQILEAAKNRTADEDERARVSREQLAVEVQKRDDDIVHNGKIKKLSDDQIELLRRKNREAGAAQAGTINFAEDQRHIAEAADLRIQELKVQADILTEQAGIAKSSAERHRIELLLLANAEAQEREAIKPILDDNLRPDGARFYSAKDRADAVARSSAIDREHGGKVAAIDDRNKDALDRFIDPKSADQINESLRNIAADGLTKVNDGLADAILHVHSLGGAFKSIADSIISDLLRIAIQQSITGPLGAALFGGGGASSSGGGGLGGILGSIGGIFGAGTSGERPVFGGGSQGNANGILSLIGARAGGGPVSAGGTYLVGENGPEIVRMRGAGHVYPNGTLPNIGGSGGQTVIVQQSFTLDARHGITTPQLLQHVNDVASQKAAQAGSAAYNAGQAAVPGRIARQQTLGT